MSPTSEPTAGKKSNQHPHDEYFAAQFDQLDAMLQEAKGVDQGNITEAGTLDTASAVQTLGTELRDQFTVLLRQGHTPEEIAASFIPHGDVSHLPLALDAAMTQAEKTQRVLDLIAERMQRGEFNEVGQDPLKMDKIAARLAAGGKPRENNTDLTDAQIEEVRALLTGDKLAEFDRTIQKGRSLKTAIGPLVKEKESPHHHKFPGMLSLNFFKETVDASQEPGVMVYFDLILFKNFNSVLSEDFVDEPLKYMCQTLKDKLPAGAFATIKGGDEFAVFVPGELDPKKAIADIARIIEEAMQSLPLQLIQDNMTLIPKKQKPPALSFANAKEQWLELVYGKKGSPKRDVLEAEKIKARFLTLHAKMSAMVKTTKMPCATVFTATKGGADAVDKRDDRANKRFPACVVDADGVPGPAFSATGKIQRDFFLGAWNDFMDTWRRFTRT